MCCILSKFYIKPQLRRLLGLGFVVVSYRNSTSNHNSGQFSVSTGEVVSYRNSTSNHNNVLYNVIRSAVVSYRNSTSNHNTGGLASGISGLYLIEILHQTTTMSRSTSKATTLYLIEILHQTTTLVTLVLPLLGCILSKFYIKPQQAGGDKHRTQSCILSKFYIKPQLDDTPAYVSRGCILSKFYIKPQHMVDECREIIRCILSKFYIKPQPGPDSRCHRIVVSYRNSTSNHNGDGYPVASRYVVSYRNSTSNHNYLLPALLRQVVVSYRNSTSNHNKERVHKTRIGLYLIEILHQTTTPARLRSMSRCCILSKFYIKPQLLDIFNSY